ncbi:DUF3558 family protein [Actinocrispum sp. NPDC049592]|uniref:DUF3558 family protein n=1 Tax=Actinocrispum sp. NPDC049592 TaxID=3154835 RepID=UPI0034405EE9
MKRFAMAATLGVACVATLVGCSSQTPGVPSAGSTAGQGGPSGDPFPTSAKSSSTPSSSKPPKGPLAGAAPCTLLGASDISALGLKDQKEGLAVGDSRSCDFHYSGFIASLKVAIYDEHGIGDVQDRTQLTQMPVGKHEAVRGYTGAGGCAFAIKITESSRVDVVASRDGNEQKSCELALPAAQAVEQKLPSS